MTATEQVAELRQELRARAEALADLGVPPEVSVADLRAGYEQAERRRARAGR